MLGLLVGAIADLELPALASNCADQNPRPNRSHIPDISLVFPPLARRWPGPVCREVPRTDGIARLPLNRLRTRLSIPLGLRHAASTHLKRSLWWRMKPLVPAYYTIVNDPSHMQPHIGVVVVGSRRAGVFGVDIRFLTIGTCFFAETILTACCQYLLFNRSLD